MRKIISGLLASLLVASILPPGATGLELVPLAPDHVGLTMRKYPSLCWILIGKPAVGATITFTLMDSRSTTPTFEDRLPSSFLAEKNETCRCLNLKDYGIPLETNSQYRWFISIGQNPESHKEDIVVGGMIERCDFEKCLVIIDTGGVQQGAGNHSCGVWHLV